MRELFPEAVKLSGVFNGRCLGNEEPDPALPCPSLGPVIWKALFYLLSSLLHEAFLAPLRFRSHRRTGNVNHLLPAPWHLSRLWLGLFSWDRTWDCHLFGWEGTWNSTSPERVLQHYSSYVHYDCRCLLKNSDFAKGMCLVGVRQVWKSTLDQAFSSAHTILSLGLIRPKQELRSRWEGQCSWPLGAQET